MAITIARQVLSESTDGLTITVTATSPSLTAIIHTGSSLTSVTDEVFIYCWAGMPQSTAAGTASTTVLEPGRQAAFFIGSTADESYTVGMQAGEKPKLAIAGLLIKGAATPLTITAHRPNSNSSFPFYVSGYVNRITET